MTDLTTDGDRVQVTLEWDKRCLPRCSGCKKAMRINRKHVQFVTDMPLGPASCVLVRYDAVQGYCNDCGRCETVRALDVVEQAVRR